MPYSDPERKKEYMKKYNTKYYKGNTKRIVLTNTKRKKTLRQQKKDFILSSVNYSCPHCLGDGVLTVRFAGDGNLYDFSWQQIKLSLTNGLIDIYCSTCHKIGKPEDNH